MGGAILKGMIAGGCPPSAFHVHDPFASALPEGVVRRDSQSAAGRFDVVLLAIKPQLLTQLAGKLRPMLADGAILVSVLAGIRIGSLQALFPTVRVVRLMPNLAAALGKSPMALCAPGLDAKAQGELSGWLGHCGPVEWIAEESDMDLVTALAGSGPAYLYRFIDALARGAAELGLPADQASRMALATVEGAAMLAVASGESPGVLADRVASPGGSTREGMNVLDNDDALAHLLRDTLAAARDRNIELSLLAEKP